MEIQTYETTEVNETGAEFEQEQMVLIDKLGLDGQKGLISDGAEGEKNLCPYRKMTREEKFVYETTLSKKTALVDYSDGAIPTRVLQVAAHAQELNLGKLMVWHPENADDPDPVLVARVGESYSPSSWWLLARWGDVLAPFGELRTKAIAKAREILKGDFVTARRDIDSKLELIDEMPDEAFMADMAKDLYSRTFKVPS